MATKLVLHTDRISEEQLAQVEQLLNKIVPADIPVEKYNHLIELPWQGIYPDMESNSAWLQKLSLLIKEITGNIEFNLRLLIDENKLIIQLGLDTTQAQIDEVKSLLNRALPHNLVTEMEWADGLPIDYTHVDYLNTNYNAYIVVPVEWNDALEFKADIYFEKYGYYEAEAAILNNTNPGGVNRCLFLRLNTDNRTRISWAPPPVGDLTTHFRYQGQRKLISFSKGLLRVDAAEYPFNSGSMSNLTNAQKNSRAIFGSGTASGGLFHFYSAQILKEGALMFNGIPSINPEGQPGMYDTVNKVFKTNSGSGDFLYPGKETEATTYSLRNRMYGKITEHGIRRLYRVPAGYNSKEEYAEQNGFKLIIEPPMPEEGHWASAWHDHEDYIELEWVETEPPIEENS